MCRAREAEDKTRVIPVAGFRSAKRQVGPLWVTSCVKFAYRLRWGPETRRTTTDTCRRDGDDSGRRQQCLSQYHERCEQKKTSGTKCSLKVTCTCFRLFRSRDGNRTHLRAFETLAFRRLV